MDGSNETFKKIRNIKSYPDDVVSDQPSLFQKRGRKGPRTALNESQYAVPDPATQPQVHPSLRSNVHEHYLAMHMYFPLT